MKRKLGWLSEEFKDFDWDAWDALDAEVAKMWGNSEVEIA